MNQLIAFFIRKRVFVDMLTIFTLIVGVAAVFLLKKEVFPNVNFDIITITTQAPGASGEEVEKLITNPLEQDLQEIDGIKKMQSKSIEGRSFILIQLDPDQTTEDEGKRNIQDVVDRYTLPAMAQEPVVTSVKSDQTPIIEIAVGGDIPELELRETARELEKQIEAIPGVARVVQRGLRDKEVRVEADPKLLARYRLTLEDIVNSLKRQNVLISAGTLEARSLALSDKEKIVRTIGEFRDLKDVENTVVRANETAVPIRVGQLAKVFYDLEKPDILSRTNGKPSLNLTVLKKRNADAINVVDDLNLLFDRLRPTLNKNLDITFINDFSQFIRRRISVLSGNLLLGLVLVFGMLALFLQPRIATLVAIGIPFSFLGTMIVFHNMGYSINLVSLLGLIIVSGMLVDDAIVVTDNCERLLQEGNDPMTAATRGTQEVWPAVTASVLTTVVAFLPMMFMSGIFGKFVREIPLGVIFSLLFSMGEAFFMLPTHFAHFIKIKKRSETTKPGGLQRFGWWFEDTWNKLLVPRYIGVLKWAVSRRYLVAGGAIALFAGTVVYQVKVGKFVLFPPDGAELFFIRMQTPTGASLRQTELAAVPMEKILSKLPANELKSYVLTTGLQAQDANDPETRRGYEYAQIGVFLTPPSERKRSVAQIIEALRPEISAVPNFTRIAFEEIRNGPPVGKPVSLHVRATLYEDIFPVVEKLKQILGGYKGVTDILDSWMHGKQELVLKVNPSEASAAGLSVAQIGSQVRAAFEGIEATTIKGLDEEVQVRVTLPKAARSDEGTLHSLLLNNSFNQLVPLKSVATIVPGTSISLYEHENNQREVRVTADVDIGETSAGKVNGEIRKLLPELAKEFPRAQISFGGEDKDTAESMESLGRAFIVAGFAIFLILVFTFQNIFQPLLVMTTIPLGIMSVIWAFAVHGRPLSFMGLLGVIALGGVIVNNAIIFVDFVNSARRAGKDRFTSIVDAATMRIRPIFLTTATTVAGLLPTAYGIGGSDEFVVPIALALGWGLLFGSILTSLVLPPALGILDDIEAFVNRKLS